MKIFHRILLVSVLLIILCYHACFADFWRGYLFARKHRNHKSFLNILTSSNGIVTVHCDFCKVYKEFHGKKKIDF